MWDARHGIASIHHNDGWQLVEKPELSGSMTCSARCGARVVVRPARKHSPLSYAVELISQCTRCGDGQAWQAARKVLVVELEDLVASVKCDVLDRAPESLDGLLETMRKCC